VRQAHVQTPQAGAAERSRDAVEAREHEVGGDERCQPAREHEPAIDPVGKRAGRRRGDRIDEIHRDQHRGDPGEWQSHLARPQDQERLAEAREGEHDPDGGHRPVRSA
jgi:hypothetical protein